MTAPSQPNTRAVERGALILAAVAALCAIVFGLRSPENVAVAWRLATFLCLMPVLGSMLFILVYRLTGGRWMQGLAPFLLAGARLLPWVWLLILPLLWFPLAAQPYTAAPHEPVRPLVTSRASETADIIPALENAFAPEPSRHFGETVRLYFSRPAIVVRAGLYAAVFFLLAAGARRAMRPERKADMRWFGPVGLIGLAFMLHLLATDWIMMLDPGWHSTGFPLVWMSGQAVAGLAAATAASLWIGGVQADAGEGRPRGLDWGNLLLASVMSWAYVAFVQWLIIWSGNLPSETSWYLHRSRGAWHLVLVAMTIIEFGAPFSLLLSRRLKQSRRALGAVALLMLVGQLGYMTWIIAPAFPRADASAPWLEISLAIAALGLLSNRYLALARSSGAALRAP
jgi:hypothetical protein